MKFISRYAKFMFNAEGGTQRWVTDTSGNSRQVDNNDGLLLQFEPGGLRGPEEQQSAVEIFERANPQHPWGAAPKMSEDVISAQEAMAEGEAHNAHEAFMPYQRIGVFDTDNPVQCPVKWKERAEEALLNSADFGLDLFRLDNYNLTPPWPTYPTAATIKADGVIAFATQGGYDFTKILNYEKATTNRKNLVAALEEAVASQQQAEVEQQALAIK